MKEYFAGVDTPSENSPVGRLMVKILEQRPNLSYEVAREEANAMLQQAAGRFHYRTPIVLTPEQEADRRARLVAWTAQRRSKASLQGVSSVGADTQRAA